MTIKIFCIDTNCSSTNALPSQVVFNMKGNLSTFGLNLHFLQNMENISQEDNLMNISYLLFELAGKEM